MEREVSVVGGGLAGSECALQLARRGVHVKLYEMRPVVTSPAHHSEKLAELVCSNSFKSLKDSSCAGLLKHELGMLHSCLLEYAFAARVEAGGALAVDRELFSQLVTTAIEEHPLIELIREEVREIPEGHVVIAAGPLCSSALFSSLAKRLGSASLSFYDAAAPIVDALSLDENELFRQSRYGKDSTHTSACSPQDARTQELGEEAPGDYLNCPFTKEEYLAFYEALIHAERVIAKDFEKKELFQACQPVEEIARTGVDSLRYGPMKPVGISYPDAYLRTHPAIAAAGYRRPYAVVQLRSENAHHTSYNLVGFQTNLTWPDQKTVFRMIPGLAHAEFFRYGVMHRNSFVQSPQVLDTSFALPHSSIRLAGQITGTEGYTEAIASGLYAALNTWADLEERPRYVFPKTMAMGSLFAWATSPFTTNYQPMHVNYGIIEPLPQHIRNKEERKMCYATRARADLADYLAQHPELLASCR